jgi:hypothetical protein
VRTGSRLCLRRPRQHSNRYRNAARTMAYPGGRRRTPQPCDLRKQDTNTRTRTPGRQLRVKGAQVQILSARQ